MDAKISRYNSENGVDWILAADSFENHRNLSSLLILFSYLIKNKQFTYVSNHFKYIELRNTRLQYFSYYVIEIKEVNLFAN